MLELAIRAGLPLIAVVTRDTLNAAVVLKHITNKEPEEYTGQEPEIKSDTLYYALADTVNEDVASLYSKLVEADSTLVILNFKKVPEVFFNAGVLPTPKGMIQDCLEETLADYTVEGVIPVLGGLTLREILEVIRLTMARDGDLTPTGIVETRKQYFQPTQGLSLVDTTMEVYMPDWGLEHYVKDQRDFFHKDFDYRLRPRGFLADGEPGTGKTMAAKFMAREWGVPLFRLDATIQSKWVGESEANLEMALNQIMHEAPVIFLIDEVEKLFQHGADSTSAGVIPRLLSTLLWFLQEHRSKVFTIMTTNNKKLLPPELYRRGRMDFIRIFKGLNRKEAKNLADLTIESFDGLKDWSTRELHSFIGKQFTGKKKLVTHAQVVSATHEFVKGVLDLNR